MEDLERSREQRKNDKSCISHPFPMETIRRLSQSGFLNFKELGKLLLLTSSSLRDQLGDNFVWSCICTARYPRLTSSIFGGNADPCYSHQKLFQQLSSSRNAQRTTDWPPYPIPNITLESVVILVEWYANGRAATTPTATIVLSKSTNEEVLTTLLETGQVKIPIPEDLYFMENDLAEVYSTVHCVRLDRQECCCLHETEEFNWCPNQPVPGMGNLHLGPRAPLLLKSYGKDIETRLARQDPDTGGFELLVHAGAVRNPMLRKPWNVSFLELQFWANYNDQTYIYNSCTEFDKHGVTLLNVLDELQGWRKG